MSSSCRSAPSVSFPNDDKDEHNVFSPTDPPFDLGRYRTDKKGKAHRFEDADEFDIFCDIHREMWAKVKVVDSAPDTIRRSRTERSRSRTCPPATTRSSRGRPTAARSAPRRSSLRPAAALPLRSRAAPPDDDRSGCHDRKDGTPYDAKYGGSARSSLRRCSRQLLLDPARIAWDTTAHHVGALALPLLGRGACETRGVVVGAGLAACGDDSPSGPMDAGVDSPPMVDADPSR